jgi:hypothetical protein
MTMKKTIKQQLSPLARRVRQGIVPFRSGPDGDSARQLLQGLRADLDAVHRDQRSSANEKDAASKRLLSTFKQRWTYEQTKANERAADVDRAARVLAGRVAEIERSMSPFDVLRAERLAEALQKMHPNARAADFGAAIDRHDIERVLAHGLADVVGTTSKRALAAMLDGSTFQYVLDNGRAATAQRAAVEAVGRAIDEMAAHQDPYEAVPVDAAALMNTANRGVRAIVADADVDNLVAKDAPPFLRDLLLPPKGQLPPLAPVADQQQDQQTNQQDQQPPAGAA